MHLKIYTNDFRFVYQKLIYPTRSHNYIEMFEIEGKS